MIPVHHPLARGSVCRGQGTNRAQPPDDGRTGPDTTGRTKVDP